MHDAGAFIWKQRGRPRRLMCVSPELQAHIWPYIFTVFTPAARPMCQWASRNGAKMHPALRLVSRGDKGLGVVSLRALPKATPVMSIPTRLALSSSNEDRQTLFLGTSNPLEQLSHMFVRGLVDPTCPWKRYLEFLHDSHNMDLEEDELLNSDPKLSDAVDVIMGGNALVTSGVSNAPFLDKKMLQQAKSRVQWVRWQQARRELEQAVPHYAAQAAPWAISMVLSRSFACPEELCDTKMQEWMVVPLVDMLNHSSTCNASTTFSFPSQSRRRCTHSADNGSQKGVLHYDASEAHVHVVLTKDVKANEEITLCYSNASDPEYWLLKWGFVPAVGTIRTGVGQRTK
jgi:hypothetical protein